MDNILGILLDIKGKTKDNLAARKDLEEMGLRPTLYPFTQNEKRYMLAACHMMSTEDKTNFLKVLQDVRVPDGYASNIFRCLKFNDCTISGLK